MCEAFTCKVSIVSMPLRTGLCWTCNYSGIEGKRRMLGTPVCVKLRMYFSVSGSSVALGTPVCVKLRMYFSACELKMIAR